VSGAEAETARISALKELLDRAYGRATQPVSGDSNAAPIAYSFRWADATPQPTPEPDDGAAEAGVPEFVVAFETC
jgi:hypothetical protein